jgi:hypothetical protein
VNAEVLGSFRTKFVPPVKWHNETLLALLGSARTTSKHGDFVGGGGFTSADANAGAARAPIRAPAARMVSLLVIMSQSSYSFPDLHAYVRRGR